MSPAQPIASSSAGHVVARLEFTGTGADYFRIWVAHTLLTLLTVGVYSAWAKARRERWFSRHTRLMGDAFNYHGRPNRIFTGRLLAVIGYLVLSHAPEWSVTGGLLLLALFIATGPVFLGSALRFRARNMSWRGARFDFDASARDVYLACLPVLVLLTMSPMLLLVRAAPVITHSAAILTVLIWPGVHASLKALQHRSTRLGATRFDFKSATVAFYGLYGKAVLLVFVLSLTLGWLVKTRSSLHGAASVTLMLTLICLYLIVWPYYTVRMQQLVWSHTTYGDIRFKVEIRTTALWQLIGRNLVLILLTAGIYWPFAAVAMARFRVESLSLSSRAPLPEALRTATAAQTRPLGDAVADLFGIDVGW